MTVTTVEVDLPSAVYLNKVIAANRSKAGRGYFQEVL